MFQDREIRRDLLHYIHDPLIRRLKYAIMMSGTTAYSHSHVYATSQPSKLSYLYSTTVQFVPCGRLILLLSNSFPLAPAYRY